MRFFRSPHLSPHLAKGRDVLTVICDRCDMIAATFADGVPLCPDCLVQAEVQKERPMTAPLPPFNLVSRCPKCGQDGGGPEFGPVLPYRGLHPARPDPFPVEYHRSTLAFGRYPCSLELHVEHLHRTCPRCAFGWAEACPQFPDNRPMLPVSQVRPEVWAFALLMERELAKHDNDSEDWKRFGKSWFLIRLREQVERLAQDGLDANPAFLGHRAADTANYCMFIADVGGALAPKKEDVS